MSASAGHPTEGTQIGPYRIVSEIGGGGMGVVYEAADDALDRRVALKIISPHLAQNADFRERFTREAQALAALDSPQVVHVYAHGEVDGRLYIATQLIPDGDLGAWLQEFGAPPMKVALDLVAQVATGLADAHEAGMIHRDLKPANVLLRRRGDTVAAYLGDFGIARRLDVDATGSAHTGTIGTPSYMAPEIHTGGAADVRADIYSLGCLLWATLSGHAPYRGTTEYQIISAHLEQPVPQLPGGSPLVQATDRILRTAMAKDPADRYASAAELRDDLRRARSISHAATAPSRRAVAGAGPDRGLIASLAVLVLVALVTAVVWGLSGGDEETPDRESASATSASTGSPGTPPGELTPADRERASASFSEELLEQGVVADREQAECTADEWIDDVGLRQLMAEGYFTGNLDYVDVEIDQASQETQRSLAAATMSCLAG